MLCNNPDLCRKLLDGGAKIVQFRNKNIDNNGFYSMAEEMLSMIKIYDNAILIINDRVEIAFRLKAHGIHVGQEDDNYKTVIRCAPCDMIVGVSVDNVRQAVEAEQAGASYVGAGSVFPTPTKPDAVIIGIGELGKIVRAVNIPVVAIGGITLENIGEVVNTGAQYYAVISGLNNAQDIPARLNGFFRAIKK